jgi:hypothetical protein
MLSFWSNPLDKYFFSKTFREKKNFFGKFFSDFPDKIFSFFSRKVLKKIICRGNFSRTTTYQGHAWQKISLVACRSTLKISWSISVCCFYIEISTIEIFSLFRVMKLVSSSLEIITFSTSQVKQSYKYQQIVHSFVSNFITKTLLNHALFIENFTTACSLWEKSEKFSTINNIPSSALIVIIWFVNVDNMQEDIINTDKLLLNVISEVWHDPKDIWKHSNYNRTTHQI